MEASDTCLRLFLLAAQVADECNLEELTYEFYVQAFVIYEESISESRAQLQAIAAIISNLQTSRVFGTDNYDTLITKAALHGSKLLKKPHQATAVFYASHMWWQMDVPGREKSEKVGGCDRDHVLMNHGADQSLLCSPYIEMASECSSACRSHCVSQAPALTR